MKVASYSPTDPRFPGLRGAARGYTLVEVMVAVGILGMMVVSLYAGFSSGFAVLRTSRERTRATQVLLQKVETIRMCSWSQLPFFPQNFQEPLDPRATNGAAFYYGNVSFDAPGAIPDSTLYKTNMQQVTVTVWWTNFNGSVATRFSDSMTTLVARYGAQNFALKKSP
jgi:prepilin-type N-terminal cleavage/methylation domain-containing protein